MSIYVIVIIYIYVNLCIYIGIENFTILKFLGIITAVTGAVLIDAWKTDDSASSDESDSDIIIGIHTYTHTYIHT